MESNATSRSVFLKIVQHTFSLVVQDRSIIFTYIQKEFSGKRTNNVKKGPTALILCLCMYTINSEHKMAARGWFYTSSGCFLSTFLAFYVQYVSR